MVNDTPLLTVQNVGVVYPDGTQALDSIGFSAQSGEFVSIIGRSGAGKSTLLRCINGLQALSNGDIFIAGDHLAHRTETELNQIRQKIGFIWQEHNLVLRLTAFRNVLLARLSRNSIWNNAIGYFDRHHRAIAYANLERVNLIGRAHLRADRLSGGEKQRVAIARAMSQEPLLLLADEPVASLDPELAVQVLSDLSRITREDGVLTIVNLHQVELARQFSDRIIGIAQGRVVFDGKPHELTHAHLARIYRNQSEWMTAAAS